MEDLSNLIETSFEKCFRKYQEIQFEKPKDPEELLTIEDLVKMFNVSKVTIHKWKKKGIIPFYKMNRRVFFKKSEVIESMQQKKRKLEI